MRRLLLVMFFMIPVCVTAMERALVRDASAGVIGMPAPDFKLETTAGVVKSLSEMRQGKKAMLFFWATWCPHCREELARIKHSQAKIKAEGIEIILVNEGESRNTVEEYLRRNGIDWDSFIDEDSSLQGPYQLIGLPTLYFVDEHGSIVNMQHSLGPAL